jgi:hypothetical protein
MISSRTGIYFINEIGKKIKYSMVTKKTLSIAIYKGFLSKLPEELITEELLLIGIEKCDMGVFNINRKFLTKNIIDKLLTIGNRNIPFSMVPPHLLTDEVIITILKKKLCCVHEIDTIDIIFYKNKKILIEILKFKFEIIKNTKLPYELERIKNKQLYIDANINFDDNIKQLYYNEIMLKYQKVIDIIPHEHKNDKEIIFTIIEYFPHYYKNINNSLKKDPEIIIKIINKRPSLIKYVPICMQTYEISLLAVQKNGIVLELLQDKYKNDYNIVMNAVLNNGLAIQFANIEFKQNYNLALEAVKQNGKSLIFLKSSAQSK